MAGTTEPSKAEQGLVTGTLPLTPPAWWFFEQNHPDPHHWKTVVFLEMWHVHDPAEQVVQLIDTTTHPPRFVRTSG